MRASGARDVLIYCRDHRCNRHVAVSADRWPDHVRLSDIEPDFVCTACGKRCAEVRPAWVLVSAVVHAVRRPDHRAGWAQTDDAGGDAATYITGLPKAEHDAEEWQTAMETLLLIRT
jgi:hypothetical protein